MTVHQDMFKAVRYGISQPFLYALSLVISVVHSVAYLCVFRGKSGL